MRVLLEAILTLDVLDARWPWALPGKMLFSRLVFTFKSLLKSLSLHLLSHLSLTKNIQE